jgi:hypothetical protein
VRGLGRRRPPCSHELWSSWNQRHTFSSNSSISIFVGTKFVGVKEQVTGIQITQLLTRRKRLWWLLWREYRRRTTSRLLKRSLNIVAK